MKPYYSIADLANLLDDQYARVADALVASGVPLIYEGKAADISRWERIQPPTYNSNGVQVIYVTTGGQDPLPSPKAVVVSAEALPESWTQRIKASVGTEEESPERYLMKPPDSMPKSRLISITGVLMVIEDLSDGELTMDEITDALYKVIDGNTMIYDGSWKGLCPAIDGNSLDEYSGFNRRQDIIADLFNSKYWESQDYFLKGVDGKIKASDYMVLKKDGGNIAKKLWHFFYPKDSDKDFDLESFREQEAKPTANGVQATPSPDPLQECAEVHQAISGQTFERLQRAIEAFPGRYPDYKTNPPKLNVDVRTWLHEIKLVNDGANGREAIVFGRIIAESFKLSNVTKKTK